MKCGETHTVCKNRLKKEGGKAKCCYCSPHKDCDFILCKTCYFKEHFDHTDYCSLIENEGGGSVIADKKECKLYLKKGTEPHWDCCMCGTNTYGHASTGTGGKTYCSGCWSKKEYKEYLKSQRIKEKENLKKVASIVGIEKAKLIIKILK
jgi:hypothetical protein